MGYITCTTQIILLLVANVFQVFAITTRLDHEASPSRNFRRHIGTLPVPDWELGLREAVYQALLRERNLHPNLREFLYSAPIIGQQDSATPFGDIVILARGQLYSAPGGFQFVQDPYKNDCDECHNAPPRCDRTPCENWRPEGHERLLALWSVKRIRHRDSNYGYKYELEYKVSPMNVPVNEPFVTRNGRFDYSMPGHTFIVKSNPRQYEPSYQSVSSRHDKVYRSSNYDSNSWSPNFGPNFDGRYLPPPPPPLPPPVVEEYYDEDPRNAGYPNVLYGPPKPEIYTKKPYYITKHPQNYDEDKEAEPDLFKDLFETSKTSTTGQVPLSTASTQHIYTPTMTTKSSPQPTIPTTPQFSPKTTNSYSSYHPTSGQAPLLPTIPIQNSIDTTDISQGNPLTTHRDDATPTKSTVRFPTTVSSRSTSYKPTSTIRFPESTHFVKYSEPDPLYITSVTPTPQPMLTSKLYPTRTTKEFKLTTKKYKTTQSDDYDIFGVREEPAVTEKHDRQNNGMRFPGLVNIKVPPGAGEQVIKVVSAPTIIPKIGERHEETTINAEHSQTSRTTPKYQVNFNNTQLLQPNGESYITVGFNPSTRGRPSTISTLNTESSKRYETTTKILAPERTVTQESSIEPTKTSINGKLTTRNNTTLSTEETATVRPLTRAPEASTIYETVPLTRTTGKINRATTPQTTETYSASYATSSSTNPFTLLTSSTSKATQPVLQSTRRYSPSTKATSPSTKTTSPLTKITPPSTDTPPSTKAYLPTSAITISTRAGQLSPKTITTTKQKILLTKPVTRKYKLSSTIDEGTTYMSSTSSGTITNYPMTTDTLIASTIPSKLSKATIIPSTSDSATDSTVATTNIDTTSSIFSTKIPQTTYALPKSRKTTRVPSISTKSTVPVTYTTPMITTTIMATESTVPIPRTSQIVTHSSTFPTKTLSTSTTTHLTKIPSRTVSSTTQATADNFLFDNKDNPVSKTPKDNKPRADDFDLDIFGKPQEKATTKAKVSKMQQHRESFNSKEIDDIFGSEPVKTQPVRDEYYDYDNTQPPASTTSKVKIIYTDFFSPSTPSAEKTTKTNLKEELESSLETTTAIEASDSSENTGNKTAQSEPLTSQSYSTSVSVEVNKRNEITTTGEVFRSSREFEPNSKEISQKQSEYKETTQAPCNTTEKTKKLENNKIFDMLALSVVNHAKSIDILNSNNNDNSNNNNNNNSSNNNHNSGRERRYKRKRTYRVQKIRRRN